MKNKHFAECPNCGNNDHCQMKNVSVSWEQFQNTTTYENKCEKCEYIWTIKRRHK